MGKKNENFILENLVKPFIPGAVIRLTSNRFTPSPQRAFAD
jgi:hypothetical protein